MTSVPSCDWTAGCQNRLGVQSTAMKLAVFWCAAAWCLLAAKSTADDCQPEIIGRVGGFLDVAVSGGVAYVAAGYSGLQVIDVEDPENPKIIARVETHGYAHGVAASGDVAYVVDDSSFQVIAVDDRRNPRILSILSWMDARGGLLNARDIAVSGDVAYVVGGLSLWLIDVKDPEDPKIFSQFLTPTLTDVYAVVVSGGVAYMASDSGLQLIDVEDPENPTFIASVAISVAIPDGQPSVIAVGDGVAYVATGSSGLSMIDIEDPENPAIIGRLETLESQFVNSVVVSGRLAYLGGSSFQVFDVGNPKSPKILGSMETGHWRAVAAASGEKAYMLLKGRLGMFAPSGLKGFQVIDVENPRNPRILGSLYGMSWASDVAVSGGMAYVAEYEGGLHVIDIRNPENPAIIASIEVPIYDGIIAVSGNVACVTGGAEETLRLYVFDISSPTSPTLLGFVRMSGLSWPEDVVVAGGVAYVAVGYSGLCLIDIKDPENPTILAVVDTPGGAWDVAVAGGVAYVANDGSGLLVIDVEDAEDPTILAVVDTTGHADGVAVSGGVAYVADSDRLLVIDVGSPAEPMIMGSMDTSAEDVVISGEVAYVTNYWEEILAIDVGNLAEPRILGSVRISSDFHFGDIAVTGDAAYLVEASGDLIVTEISSCRSRSPVFLRGNCNGDGEVDISDAVFTFGSLFLGEGDPGCDDACDSNDDGTVDITDGIYLLKYLFLDGKAPREPFTACGVDPTPDALTCERSMGCQ